MPPIAKTFKLVLKQPFPLLLDVLGKPNAPLPVMMPARLAATPADQRIGDPIGSGPFRFLKDQWRPGNAMVLERNPAYVPRKEAPDFLAGGKNVKIDQLTLARHARPVDRRQRPDGGRDRLHAVPAVRHAAAAGEGQGRQADGAGRHPPVPGQLPPEPCLPAVRQSGGAQGDVEAGRPGRDPDGDRRARAVPQQVVPVVLDVRHAAHHRRRRERRQGRPRRGQGRAQGLGLQGRAGDHPRGRGLDQPDRLARAGPEHARRGLHRRAAAARLADRAGAARQEGRLVDVPGLLQRHRHVLAADALLRRGDLQRLSRLVVRQPRARAAEGLHARRHARRAQEDRGRDPGHRLRAGAVADVGPVHHSGRLPQRPQGADPVRSYPMFWEVDRT